jgi:CheY-like chemotaxis protein
MNEEIHKILVCVDDDPMILQMLSFQLNNRLDPEQYLIECFTEPAEVISTLKSYNIEPDERFTMIVDFQMPGMTGADLVREIKANFPNSRCMMLSGQYNEIVVNELLENKLLDAFISKPWNEEMLLEKLTNLDKKS